MAKRSEAIKEIEQQISARLKQARCEAGYKSARQFSQTHQLPKTTYWQHENGKRSISAGYLYEYVRILKLSSHWLVTGSDFETE